MEFKSLLFLSAMLFSTKAEPDMMIETDASLSLSTTAAGGASVATITFTAQTDIAVRNTNPTILSVRFPAGFSVGTASATTSGFGVVGASAPFDATITNVNEAAAVAAANVVEVQISGPNDLDNYIPNGRVLTLKLAGLTNPSSYGLTGSFRVQVADKRDGAVGLVTNNYNIPGVKLSGLTVSTSTDQAHIGSTATYKFYTASVVSKTATIEFTVPSGYEAADATTAASGTNNFNGNGLEFGGVTTVAGVTTVTATLDGQGSDIADSAVLEVSVSGLTNPAAVGTPSGSFTVKVGGSTFSAPAVDIDSNKLLSSKYGISLSPAVAHVPSQATVTFETTSQLPNNGKIALRFPEGFSFESSPTVSTVGDSWGGVGLSASTSTDPDINASLSATIADGTVVIAGDTFTVTAGGKGYTKMARPDLSGLAGEGITLVDDDVTLGADGKIVAVGIANEQPNNSNYLSGTFPMGVIRGTAYYPWTDVVLSLSPPAGASVGHIAAGTTLSFNLAVAQTGTATSYSGFHLSTFTSDGVTLIDELNGGEGGAGPSVSVAAGTLDLTSVSTSTNRASADYVATTVEFQTASKLTVGSAVEVKFPAGFTGLGAGAGNVGYPLGFDKGFVGDIHNSVGRNAAGSGEGAVLVNSADTNGLEVDSWNGMTVSTAECRQDVSSCIVTLKGGSDIMAGTALSIRLGNFVTNPADGSRLPITNPGTTPGSFTISTYAEYSSNGDRYVPVASSKLDTAAASAGAIVAGPIEAYMAADVAANIRNDLVGVTATYKFSYFPSVLLSGSYTMRVRFPAGYSVGNAPQAVSISGGLTGDDNACNGVGGIIETARYGRVIELEVAAGKQVDARAPACVFTFVNIVNPSVLGEVGNFEVRTFDNGGYPLEIGAATEKDDTFKQAMRGALVTYQHCNAGATQTSEMSDTPLCSQYSGTPTPYLTSLGAGGARLKVQFVADTVVELGEGAIRFEMPMNSRITPVAVTGATAEASSTTETFAVADVFKLEGFDTDTNIVAASYTQQSANDSPAVISFQLTDATTANKPAGTIFAFSVPCNYLGVPMNAATGIPGSGAAGGVTEHENFALSYANTAGGETDSQFDIDPANAQNIIGFTVAASTFSVSSCVSSQNVARAQGELQFEFNLPMELDVLQKNTGAAESNIDASKIRVYLPGFLFDTRGDQPIAVETFTVGNSPVVPAVYSASMGGGPGGDNNVRTNGPGGEKQYYLELDMTRITGNSYSQNEPVVLRIGKDAVGTDPTGITGLQGRLMMPTSTTLVNHNSVASTTAYAAARKDHLFAKPRIDIVNGAGEIMATAADIDVEFASGTSNVFVASHLGASATSVELRQDQARSVFGNPDAVDDWIATTIGTDQSDEIDAADAEDRISTAYHRNKGPAFTENPSTNEQTYRLQSFLAVGLDNVAAYPDGSTLEVTFPPDFQVVQTKVEAVNGDNQPRFKFTTKPQLDVPTYEFTSSINTFPEMSGLKTTNGGNPPFTWSAGTATDLKAKMTLSSGVTSADANANPYPFKCVPADNKAIYDYDYGVEVAIYDATKARGETIINPRKVGPVTQPFKFVIRDAGDSGSCDGYAVSDEKTLCESLRKVDGAIIEYGQATLSTQIMGEYVEMSSYSAGATGVSATVYFTPTDINDVTVGAAGAAAPYVVKATFPQGFQIPTLSTSNVQASLYRHSQMTQPDPVASELTGITLAASKTSTAEGTVVEVTVSGGSIVADASKLHHFTIAGITNPSAVGVQQYFKVEAGAPAVSDATIPGAEIVASGLSSLGLTMASASRRIATTASLTFVNSDRAVPVGGSIRIHLPSDYGVAGAGHSLASGEAGATAQADAGATASLVANVLTVTTSEAIAANRLVTVSIALTNTGKNDDSEPVLVETVSSDATTILSDGRVAPPALASSALAAAHADAFIGNLRAGGVADDNIDTESGFGGVLITLTTTASLPAASTIHVTFPSEYLFGNNIGLMLEVYGDTAASSHYGFCIVAAAGECAFDTTTSMAPGTYTMKFEGILNPQVPGATGAFTIKTKDAGTEINTGSSNGVRYYGAQAVLSTNQARAATTATITVVTSKALDRNGMVSVTFPNGNASPNEVKQHFTLASSPAVSGSGEWGGAFTATTGTTTGYTVKIPLGGSGSIPPGSKLTFTVAATNPEMEVTSWEAIGVNTYSANGVVQDSFTGAVRPEFGSQGDVVGFQTLDSDSILDSTSAVDFVLAESIALTDTSTANQAGSVSANYAGQKTGLRVHIKTLKDIVGVQEYYLAVTLPAGFTIDAGMTNADVQCGRADPLENCAASILPGVGEASGVSGQVVTLHITTDLSQEGADLWVYLGGSSSETRGVTLPAAGSYSIGVSLSDIAQIGEKVMWNSAAGTVQQSGSFMVSISNGFANKGFESLTVTLDDSSADKASTVATVAYSTKEDSPRIPLSSKGSLKLEFPDGFTLLANPAVTKVLNADDTSSAYVASRDLFLSSYTQGHTVSTQLAGGGNTMQTAISDINTGVGPAPLTGTQVFKYTVSVGRNPNTPGLYSGVKLSLLNDLGTVTLEGTTSIFISPSAATSAIVTAVTPSSFSTAEVGIANQVQISGGVSAGDFVVFTKGNCGMVSPASKLTLSAGLTVSTTFASVGTYNLCYASSATLGDDAMDFVLQSQRVQIGTNQVSAIEPTTAAVAEASTVALTGASAGDFIILTTASDCASVSPVNKYTVSAGATITASLSSGTYSVCYADANSAGDAASDYAVQAPRFTVGGSTISAISPTFIAPDTTSVIVPTGASFGDFVVFTADAGGCPSIGDADLAAKKVYQGSSVSVTLVEGSYKLCYAASGSLGDEAGDYVEQDGINLAVGTEFFSTYIPTQGSIKGGTVIVVQGAGFSAGTQYRCRFTSGNNVEYSLAASPDDGTQFECVTPSWGSGNGAANYARVTTLEIVKYSCTTVPCVDGPSVPKTGSPATFTFTVAGAQVSGDPHFNGFDGDKYDVQGESDHVYNILTDRNMQFNAYFFKNPSMGGTVIGSIGIKFGRNRVYYDKDGNADINGEMVTDGVRHLDGGATVEVSSKPGSRKLRFTCLDYSVRLAVKEEHNERLYLNQRVTISNHRVATIMSSGISPHGLLGQTADLDGKARHGKIGADAQGEGAIEGSYKDYEIMSGNVFGDDFKFNRFGISEDEAKQLVQNVGSVDTVPRALDGYAW